MVREKSEKRINPDVPLGKICRSCHNKRKLIGNMSHALKKKISLIAEKMKTETGGEVS